MNLLHQARRILPVRVSRLTVCCIFVLMIAGNGCNPTSPTKKFTTESSTGEPTANAKRSDSPSSSTERASAPAIQFDWLEGNLSACEYHNGSEYEQFALPETTGGGIALLDYDRDGRLDVLGAGGGYPDPKQRELKGYAGTLCRATTPFQFVSVGPLARMDLSSTYNAAIIVADIDADGFDDVLCTGYSGLQLLRNQGDGTLESLPVAQVGLADTQWSSTAAFFDANGDGLLDIYVVRYADWSFDNHPKCYGPKEDGSSEKVLDYCGPRQFKGLPDSLYLNQGDGTFRDVTSAAGMDDLLRGLGVLAADLDGDLDVDLYVANDVDPNLLYRNDGDLHFTEIGRRSGVACNDVGIPEGSMGVALGDYNGDGKPDLWVTNYQNEIGALYRNAGNMLFTYASNTARIGATDESTVGWGTAFNDVDCDGDEDLIVVNGHIEIHSNGSTFEQRPQILENVDGKYFRLAPRDGSKYFQTPQSSRSLALGDLDRDGKMDFVTSRINADAALVRNMTNSSGKYLAVRLVGTKSNRNAIGAVVRLEMNGRTWVRQLVGGGSYAGTSDWVLHFGVPASFADHAASLTVRWPSGRDESFPVDRLNQELMFVEGE